MQTQRFNEWQDPDAQDDDDLDIFDLPSITPSFFENDRARQPQRIINVMLQIDQDVVSWFRSRGSGWEKRIATVLREYVEANQANPHSSKKPE